MPAFPLAALAISSLLLAVVGLAQGLLPGVVQIGFLALGLAGSYTLGRHAERRPEIPVRGAFRRMARLYQQLFALREKVIEAGRVPDRSETAPSPTTRAEMTLDLVEFELGQTLGTIEDAMEDWSDIVPEEVDELRRRRGEFVEVETLEGFASEP